MTLLKRTGIALFGLLTPCLGVAAELDLTLGNDSLRGAYVTPITQKVADTATTLDVGLLYREENDSDGLLGHVGLLIFGDAGARGANVQAGVGVRAVLFDQDSDFQDDALQGTALSLGGHVTARVPEIDRLGGRAWFYYAPDVSAFGDLDRYVEYGVSVDYQLIRQAFLVGGYRKVRIGISDAGTGEFESGGFIGVRLVF